MVGEQLNLTKAVEGAVLHTMRGKKDPSSPSLIMGAYIMFFFLLLLLLPSLRYRQVENPYHVEVMAQGKEHVWELFFLFHPFMIWIKWKLLRRFVEGTRRARGENIGSLMDHLSRKDSSPSPPCGRGLTPGPISPVFQYSDYGNPIHPCHACHIKWRGKIHW